MIKAIHLGKTAKEDENFLVYALRQLNLEGAGDNIRRKMVETVVDVAYEDCKANAPVLSGALRNAIYKEVTHGRYLIRGKVAIPTSIPYRFAVIFGDKRHKANRFMEKALDKALRYVMANFKAIVRESFGEARGK